MKISEIKKKSEEDLKNMLVREREKLRELCFKNAAGKVKNVKAISEAKKNIARILTILNQKTKQHA